MSAQRSSERAVASLGRFFVFAPQSNSSDLDSSLVIMIRIGATVRSRLCRRRMHLILLVIVDRLQGARLLYRSTCCSFLVPSLLCLFCYYPSWCPSCIGWQCDPGLSALLQRLVCFLLVLFPCVCGWYSCCVAIQLQ